VAQRNIENRGDPADYDEGKHTKGEHLSERIGTNHWQARKSRREAVDKNLHFR
jgi:hypothetical protein